MRRLVTDKMEDNRLDKLFEQCLAEVTATPKQTVRLEVVLLVTPEVREQSRRRIEEKKRRQRQLQAMATKPEKR